MEQFGWINVGIWANSPCVNCAKTSQILPTKGCFLHLRLAVLAVLAALLAAPRAAFAEELFNPTPVNCCECIEITVNGRKNVNMPDMQPLRIDGNCDGTYTFKLNVNVISKTGFDCSNVRITKIELVPVTLEGPPGTISASPAFPAGEPGSQSYDGSVTLSGFGAHDVWTIQVTCSDNATATEEESRYPDLRCRYPVTIGSRCSSGSDGGSGCSSCTSEPSGYTNGGFIYSIPLGNADAGDTSGSLEFFTPGVSFPGLGGLYANVPSSYRVVRTETSLVVTTPTTVVTAVATSGSPITITHSHIIGGLFRTTTIALVTDLTVTWLRAESEFQGNTTRYQLKMDPPSNGTTTYTLQSGPVVGGAFTALREKVLAITPNTALGTETHIATVSESTVDVSKIACVWTNYPWGWEKTQEVIDPDNQNLTSTWSYYDGVNGATAQSFGRLHHHTGYDGHEETHSYLYANDASMHVTKLPFASAPQGLTLTRSWYSSAVGNTIPANSLVTTRTTVSGEATLTLSREIETYDSSTPAITTKVETETGEFLITTNNIVPFGDDFGGKPLSVTHPDGTITTYDYAYSRAGNPAKIIGKSVIVNNGVFTGANLTHGTTTTTGYNAFGTPVVGNSILTVPSFGTVTTQDFEVTDQDYFGRPTETSFFPVTDEQQQTTYAYTTSASYSCCGIALTTDRDGVVTTYAYDGLRRRVKATSLGVTTETARHGRNTQTHRYPATTNATFAVLEGTPFNTVSLTTHNLAGTETASCSPDPSSTTAGDLVATTSDIAYTGGLITTTTKVGGTVAFNVQTGSYVITRGTDSQASTTYPDGRTFQTKGDLQPSMEYEYSVGTEDGVGLITTSTYLQKNPTTHLYTKTVEAATTTADWAGRTIQTDKGGITQHYDYFGTGITVPDGAKGQLKSVTDADGVVTLYGYNPIGERTTTALSLNGDYSIDYGIDQITVTESAPGSYDGKSVLTTTSSVYAADSSDTPTLVGVTRSTPDGASSWTSSPGPADTAIGVNFSDDATIAGSPADGFDGWIDGIGENSVVPLTLGTSGVTVTWNSSDIGSAGNDGTNDQTLYNQFLGDGETSDGVGVRVTVRGLGTWLADNGHASYQLRCYSNSATDTGFLPVTIRNGSAADSPALQSITPLVLGDQYYPAVVTPPGGQIRGYVDSPATLTADTITLTIPPHSGSNGGALCAVKITGFGITSGSASTVGLDRTETTTAADGTKTTTSYSGGRPLTVENFESGNTTPIHTITYGYETDTETVLTLKRLITLNDSRTGLTTTAYVSATCDGVASINEENGSNDRVTSFTYDSRSNRITTTHPDHSVAHTSITHNRYNSKNQLEATWGSLAYATVYSYDYAGRMHTLGTSPTNTNDEPDNDTGTVTFWRYSETTGLLTGKFHDYKTGNLTDGPTYTHTSAGRLKSRLWARGKYTRYDYGISSGRLDAVRHFTTATAGLANNGNDSGNDPDTGDVTFLYNRLGQTTQTVTARHATSGRPGIRVATDFDPNNFSAIRDIIQIDPDLASTTSAGDTDPTLQRILHRAYESAGAGRPLGYSLRHTTAANSTLDATATYDYSTTGRLETVSSNPLGGTTTTSGFAYGYLSNSNLTETVRSYLGGTTGTPIHSVTNTYESTRDVLDKKTNTNGSTTVEISATDYSVNNVGQRGGATRTGAGAAAPASASASYAYNSRGELVEANEATAAADRAYQYNDIGNREKAITGVFSDLATASANYASNALNQYTTANNVTLSGGSYDLDGNLLSGPVGASPSTSATLVWDGENRLITATVGTVTVSYIYDGLSRRVARTVGTARTYYIYDGWNCVAEYGGSVPTSGDPTANTYPGFVHTWGLDISGTMQGAGGVGGLLASTKLTAANTGTTYYPLFDGNGNITSYIDSSRNVQAYFNYDPFGKQIDNSYSNPIGLPYAFSTKALDTDTGLYYYGYRWYDPLTGRWPSRDPIEEEGGMNLYGFVGNNGVDRVDRLGEDPNSGKIVIKSVNYPNPRVKAQWSSFAGPNAWDGKFSGLEKLWGPIGGKTTIEGSTTCRCSETEIECSVDTIATIRLNVNRAREFSKEQWNRAYGHEQKHILSYRRWMHDELMPALAAESSSPLTYKRAEEISEKYTILMIVHAKSGDHQGDRGSTLSSPKNGQPFDPLDYSPGVPDRPGGW